jgi:hypothetical protein
MIKTTAMLIMLVIAGAAAWGGEPLRLESGEPLIGIYYFTHWWDPWKSNDDVIRADLGQLREMGFNTIFLDQEPSQMYDGEWAILDRDHRLAREAGFMILPWLEAKCGKDASIGDRFEQVKRRWGAELRHAERQDGTKAETMVWDEAFADYMVGWISDYLDRYSETGAILRVVRNGRPRRVISPCVEIGWELVSFDDETNERFRQWLSRRYQTIDRLNEAWATSFGDFAKVDARSKAIFDYSNLQQETQSPAVTDHTRFRAEVCRDAFARIAQRLRMKYSDLLFVAEIPYEFGYQHPHALGYLWEYAALPEMATWADIILIRSGGFPSPESVRLMAEFAGRNRIEFIYTHRTSARQGPGHGEFSHAVARKYAGQAATYANGIGYYSWNEMVDAHISRNYPSTTVPPGAEKMKQTEEEEARVSARVTRINQAYLDIVGVE